MSEPFAAVDVIATKRDRGRIRDEQLDWVIDAYTRGVVADEQMAALAMAILLNGMAPDELARWTAAMIASGERLDLSSVSPSDDGQALHRRGRRQDHAAAGPAGRRVWRAPFRSCQDADLGHTGGTLDKLESIPGWRARCPTPSSWPSSTTSAPSCAPPGTNWRRPTASSTPSAT